MKTPEQLKGTIRNISKEKNLRAQEIMQVFMFERVLERLSLSPYKSNFILKGGLLISSMIGISERTTMDMDVTVKGIPMDEYSIKKIFKKIFAINARELFHLYKDDINPVYFKMAVTHTATKRESIPQMAEYESICKEIKSEKALASLWNNYVTDETYAAHLSFNDVVQNVIDIGKYLSQIQDHQ